MAIDLEKLKAGGIIAQKQKNLFSIRVKIPGGNATGQDLRKIAGLCERYGKGYVHLTTRQGFEISFVKLEDIERVEKELKQAGLELGACGPRVRVIVTCQGTDICTDAVGDTQSLARALEEGFYGRYGIPHKFKIGVTGCPNDCAKAQEHDLGFLAVVEPELKDPEACTGCGLCAEVCPAKAIEMINDEPKTDRSKCFFDGKCIFACPEEALKVKREGWNLFIGGRWGRRPQLGTLFKEFVQMKEGLSLVEKILAAYIRLANRGERIGELITRIGLPKFKHEVYTGKKEVSYASLP
jgi:dissimilatory sulfite reductase (desulfoviridin) alpha/beta subunit